MSLRQKLQEKKIHEKELKLRDKKIKDRVRKVQLEKVNMDEHKNRRVGQIQKIKYIEKKKLEIVTEKANKLPTEIMNNISVGTFINWSEAYKKILWRTEKLVQFDSKKVNQACQAILSYAKQHHQKFIDVRLRLENEVTCQTRPIQLTLPHTENLSKNHSIIVITSLSNTEQEKTFGNLKHLNLKLVTFHHFMNKVNDNKEKQFTKGIKSKETLVFCEFQIFKEKISKLQKILQKGLMCFPIELKKIPFALRESMHSYEDYFTELLSHAYTNIKSGNEYYIRFGIRDSHELSDNIQSAVHQCVARVIQKSTTKGNRLLKAQLKTTNSVPLQIYVAVNE